jgi:hypothetical protein
LKYHAHVALLNRQSGDITLAKQYLPTFVGAFQAADNTQSGGFAAAGRA